MKNFEKYKTAEERAMEFSRFCKRYCAKCSFRKWGRDCYGNRDYCVDGCAAPQWWRDMLVENKRSGDLSGLREVVK